MRTPLQEQLLKAGLAKKHKIAAAVREQKLVREGKGVVDTDRVSAEQLQTQRAERDRALAAEQKAAARTHELRAQVRQIVETHKVATSGEIEYRFTDAGAIKSLLVNPVQRGQLAKGALVIVPHDQSYALVPRAAADMIHKRHGPVVLDHGRTDVANPPKPHDPYYDKFVVPDDLIW